MIMLNRAHRVPGVGRLATGELNGSIIDTRVIMQYAIKSIAAAVILAHNHPSGHIGAFEAGKRISGNIKESMKLVDIEL